MSREQEISAAHTAGAICWIETVVVPPTFADMHTVEELVTAAKELTPGQREELCEQIAGSLDVPLSVEEVAWAEVAERRAEELRSGKVAGVPAEESLAKARRRLGL